MKFGRAGTRLFRKGLGATLAALLGLISLGSLAAALTWEEVNQQLVHCLALTNEAKTLVEGVKGTKDSKSNKKEVAKIKKAEDKLGQVVNIYQTLSQAKLPPSKATESGLLEIKSLISRNLGTAEQSLKQTQTLREIVEGQGLGFKGGVVRVDLVVNLGSLRYQTSELQGRLRTPNFK